MPALTRGHQLLDIIEHDAVVRGAHLQSLALDIGAAGLYLDMTNQDWFVKLILQPARLIGTIDALRIDGDIRRIAHPPPVTLFIKTSHHSLGCSQAPPHRHRIHGNILVVVLIVLRFLHQEVVFPTLDDGIAEDHLLHRLLRLDPRTTCQGKAVADVDAHIQAEEIGLRKSNVNHAPELGRQLLGLSLILRALPHSADGHQVATSQSHVLHGLEVGLDASLTHGAIHPVPEGPRTRGVLALRRNREA